MKNKSILPRRNFLFGTPLLALAAAHSSGPKLRAEETPQVFPVPALDSLVLKGCQAAAAEHLGRRCVRLTGLPNVTPGPGGVLAAIPDVSLKNGTIEVDLAG